MVSLHSICLQVNDLSAMNHLSRRVKKHICIFAYLTRKKSLPVLVIMVPGPKNATLQCGLSQNCRNFLFGYSPKLQFVVCKICLSSIPFKNYYGVQKKCVRGLNPVACSTGDAGSTSRTFYLDSRVDFPSFHPPRHSFAISSPHGIMTKAFCHSSKWECFAPFAAIESAFKI